MHAAREVYSFGVLNFKCVIGRAVSQGHGLYSIILTYSTYGPRLGFSTTRIPSESSPKEEPLLLYSLEQAKYTGARVRA